ncbi:ATP-binding protein [Flavisolibacter ginsenosidimutans]|uniref:Novel STAND NTPase 1 domain-containing protein n=1 Tax=Flavisolibacter ginsenosidimutans TaxID=661481 RepID=A0A5B8UJC1_9BACT|nr:ATP-binding protein [Flavisolibacter ginsenosidimutans]QEC56643.1 hypothetical protein FSB75_12305 [Flavisolibacter ginsenosidimutans]
METEVIISEVNTSMEQVINPFKGPKSYEEGDFDVFYGRGEEISKLFQLVRINTLTILYSQSGIGKSSLLRAGIMPTLRRNDYLPIYLRPNYGNTDLNIFQFIIDQISVSIDKMTASSEHSENGYSYTKPLEDETLFEYLNRNPFYKYIPIEGEPGKASRSNLIPVLIFDQFEEIFTVGASNQNLYSFLKNELSHLIENTVPPQVKDKLHSETNAVQSEIKLLELTANTQNYKVVFSLREEYLSHLESISSEMPSIFYTNSKFRLIPFSRAIAQDVILKTSNFVFGTTTALNIIKLIAEKPNTEMLSKRIRNEVEPFLLSLVCYHLYPKLIVGDTETMKSIEILDYKIVDKILNSYYNDSLINMPGVVKVFIEDELLTDKGNRTLHDCEDAERKVGKEWIDKLVDEFRLLRKEEFLDSQHLEIIHDRVTPVIIESRNARRIEEGKVELAKAKKKQQEENERLNERKLLEIEKNKAEEYQRKVAELEVSYAKTYERRLDEIREETINDLNKKFEIDKAKLIQEYENKVAGLNTERLNEQVSGEKKLKELNDKLSLQIKNLTDSYESKIIALEQKKADDIEKGIVSLRRQYSDERDKLFREAEALKESLEKAKSERDNLEKEIIYTKTNSLLSLRTRTWFFLITSIIAIAAIVFAIIFYSNNIKNTSENRILTSRVDSLKFLYSQFNNGKSTLNLGDSLQLAHAYINRLNDSITFLKSISSNGALKQSYDALQIKYNNLLNELDNNNSQIADLKQQLSNGAKGIPEIRRSLDSIGIFIDNNKRYIRGTSPSAALNVLSLDSSRVQGLLDVIKKSLFSEKGDLLQNLTSEQIKYINSNLDQLHTITTQKSDLVQALNNAMEYEDLLNEVRVRLNTLSRKY